VTDACWSCELNIDIVTGACWSCEINIDIVTGAYWSYEINIDIYWLVPERLNSDGQQFNQYKQNEHPSPQTIQHTK
jgi:hypothetical protein